MEEEDLKLLELDDDLLGNCLHLTQVALQRSRKANWEIDEIFVGLSLVARLGFNKRFIAAKGRWVSFCLYS